MKIYIVSVMAFQPRAGAFNQTISWAEMLPALIPAHSIEEAAKNAERFAFERWQESDGWYGHSAAIKSVTQDFYEAADIARAADILDSKTNEERCFFFNRELEAEFIS